MISIVSGTYNRLSYLTAMIESARKALFSIPHEFVIVDGGSTDGTLDWLRTQSDVKLIEHGDLLGAIRAFTDGAYAARGEYVVMANDDILFHKESMLAAIAHLDDNPMCGAVAFADNRIAPRHSVQIHPARNADGDYDAQPYAQVGMFRRELGDKAGWWGADDPGMANVRTYGGDNYLSARIWEMGYRIDAIAGALIDDAVPHDNLREINNVTGEFDSRTFYNRFPGGPRFGVDIVRILPPEKRLRILYLPIYERGFAEQKKQKRGLRNALQHLGWVAEYDYVSEPHVADDMRKLVAAFKPHVLFTQFHGADRMPVQVIRQLRGLNPEMVCINWNGDYWPEVYLKDNMIELLQWYDLALVVNANILNEYAKRGIPAAYWQVASEEPKTLPQMPAYDVLFLGNNYSDKRSDLEATLRSLPYSVGIYGSGWQQADGNTTYDYARSHALMRNAKIVIGDNQYPDVYGYVSNRLFETLHAGGFLLHQPIPGLEELTGIIEGEHYATWDSVATLPNTIDYWLDNETERKRVAMNGMRYVRKNHTFDHRVKDLFTNLLKELSRVRA